MITVITQRDLIKRAARYYESNFGPFPKKITNSTYNDYYSLKIVKGTDGCNRTFEEVWTELNKLNLYVCSAEDVEKFVGKGKLVRIFCSECGLEVDKAIEFFYDIETIYICKKCLNKAISLI